MYVYAWGNNDRRAALKGRACVIEARGALGTALVRFLDDGERVTTSFRALRVRRFAGGGPGRREGMAETVEERLDEAADDEDEVQTLPGAPAAEADEEPGCTVEGGLARL